MFFLFFCFFFLSRFVFSFVCFVCFFCFFLFCCCFLCFLFFFFVRGSGRGGGPSLSRREGWGGTQPHPPDRQRLIPNMFFVFIGTGPKQGKTVGKQQLKSFQNRSNMRLKGLLTPNMSYLLFFDGGDSSK